MQTNRLVTGFLIAHLLCAVIWAHEAKAARRQPQLSVGQTGTVCGTVVAYHCQLPVRTTELALQTPFSEPGVTVAVAPADRNRFGPLFEQQIVLKNLCATGLVERQGKRFTVRIKEPGQLVVQQSAPPSEVTFPAGAVSPCDEGVRLPELLKEVKPEYPGTVNDRRHGVVVLEGVVLATGRVGSIRVLAPLDAELNAAAAQALSGWRFKPGTLHGSPAPVVVTVEMAFSLKGNER